MEATLLKKTAEFCRQQEEFFRELDKGIRDMEQGNVIPHDEFMKQMCEKYGFALDV